MMRPHSPACLDVLIVDDNDMVRTDLRTLLTLIDGVRVTGEASTASVAIQMAVKNQPDLLILDLQLNVQGEADLSGLTVLRTIKRMLPGCFIFVLTVHDYEQARREAFQAGADRFFVKGRESSGMFAAIHALIQSKNNHFDSGV